MPSPDGTLIPPATQVTDAGGAVWTLATDTKVLRNGTQASGGNSNFLAYIRGQVYVLGLDGVNWYRWNGSSWAGFGTVPPVPTALDMTVITTGQSITDANGDVWFLHSNTQVQKNGTQAGGGNSAKLMYVNGVVYVQGMNGVDWYSWSGSSWTYAGTSDPRGVNTALNPGDNIATALNNAATGARILLKAGTHRITAALQPKTNQVVFGEAGTILSGAKLLTGWVSDNGKWRVESQTQEGTQLGTVENEVCAAGQVRCGYPEDLWVDGVLLKHVASLGDVNATQWYFDYANNRIWIGTNPSGKTIETSVAPAAFTGTSNGVQIRNMVVERFATPTNDAAINQGGLAWVIDRVEVRHCHFAGIRLVEDGAARFCYVHHNGAFGFLGAGSDITVEYNEIAYNNTIGYNAYWGAGGSKWVFTNGLIVRGNFSHHNNGVGLWTDINNINALYEWNRVEDNTLTGIFHEVSYEAIIRRNICKRNGLGSIFNGWVDGAGILVSGSRACEVYENVVIDNYQGICGLEPNRSDEGENDGPWILEDLDVRDNEVRQQGTPDEGTGRSGIIDTEGSGAFSRNNVWVNNDYWLPTQTLNFVWNGADKTVAQWQSAGQDSGGSFTR